MRPRSALRRRGRPCTVSMMSVAQHPPVARVVFDEAHAERLDDPPRRRAEHAAVAPRGLLLRARGRGAARAAASRSRPTPTGRSTPPRSPDAAVLVIAHPSEPQLGAHRPGRRVAAADRRGARRRSTSGSRAGGGLVLLAEEEQDKYGNNLAELSRALRHRDRTTTSSPTTSTTTQAPQLGARATCRDRAPRRPTCSPASARPASTARPRSTPAAGRAILARAAPAASTPGAPLLAAAEHGAGRVVVAGRLRPVRRRLHRRARPRATLWLNLVHWAAQPVARASRSPRPPARPQTTRPGSELKTHTDDAPPVSRSPTARST